MKDDWKILFFGDLKYSHAMKVMNFLLDSKMKEKQTWNYFMLLEHHPVITLGKRAKKENLLLPPNYKQKFPDLEIVETDRGGDVTFHGPGQLVGYFAAEIRALGNSVADMVRNVSQLIVDSLKEYGLNASFNDELPGIWVDSTWGGGKKRKIASIGMKIVDKRHVKHGFALNVNNDLEYFRLINPCGLPSDVMTSMEKEGVETTVEEVVKTVINIFSLDREVEILERPDFLRIIGDS